MLISGKRINVVSNLLISSLISILYYWYQGEGYYDSTLRLIATIGLIPVVSSLLLLMKLREVKFGVIFLVLYQTWNMFLEPYFWQKQITSTYRVYNTLDFREMAFISAFSILALYIGFIYYTRHSKVNPIFKQSRLSVKQIQKILVWMILGGYVLGVLQSVILRLGIPFGFLNLIDTMLPATVGAVFLLYILRGGRNFFLSILVLLYMAYYFVYYVGGTLFIYSIYLVIAPLVVYIVEKKKIPYVTLALVVIALMPVFLSRHAYRKEGLLAKGEIRMAVGIKVLQNEYLNANIKHWRELQAEEQEDKNIDNRMEGVTYLGQVVNCHKREDYPFLHGETMAWLPTMIIPRFLIPFRPSQNMGDQWAIYYKLKDPRWESSINFPMLVEFYANFGYLGMIILSLLNGILIVWFMNKFNNGKGDTNLLLLIFIVTKIIVIEANVTLAYGAILQVIVVCWFIKIWNQKKKNIICVR